MKLKRKLKEIKVRFVISDYQKGYLEGRKDTLAEVEKEVMKLKEAYKNIMVYATPNKTTLKCVAKFGEKIEELLSKLKEGGGE